MQRIVGIGCWSRPLFVRWTNDREPTDRERGSASQAVARKTSTVPFEMKLLCKGSQKKKNNNNKERSDGGALRAHENYIWLRRVGSISGWYCVSALWIPRGVVIIINTRTTAFFDGLINRLPATHHSSFLRVGASYIEFIIYIWKKPFYWSLVAAQMADWWFNLS